MTTRDRTVLLVLLGAGLVAAFWFAVLGPKRDEASSLSAKIAQEQTRLTAAQQQEAAAKQARDRYASDYATVARLGKAVPVQDDVPSLVYQIESAAEKHQVDFRSLKVQPATTPTAAPPAAQVAQAGADAKGTTPATPAAIPAATVGPAGFPVIPFSFTFDGSFFAMEDFMRSLDRLAFASKDTLRVAGRLLTVNGFTLTASGKGFPKVQAVVDASAFQLPASEGLTAGATPQAPSTPQPSAGSGPATPTATATVLGGTR